MNITEEILEVCPINGVSKLDANDKTTWRIDFKDNATLQQRQAAQTVLQNHVTITEEQWRLKRERNLETWTKRERVLFKLLAKKFNYTWDQIKTAYQNEYDGIT